MPKQTPTVQVAILLSADDLEKLEWLCEDLETSRPNVIRALIRKAYATPEGARQATGEGPPGTCVLVDPQQQPPQRIEGERANAPVWARR